jgi:hypothetical protein
LNPLALPTFDEGVDEASKKMLRTLCIKAEEAGELEWLTVTMHRQVNCPVPDYKKLTFVLDANFFAILNECYMEHLEQAREYFGSDPNDVVYELYTDAYVAYTSAVKEKVANWLVGRRAELEAVRKMDVQLKAMLDGFENRLAHLLGGLFQNPTYRITFTTLGPIASTLWMKDVNDLLKYDENWLSFVSPNPVIITDLVCYYQCDIHPKECVH